MGGLVLRPTRESDADTMAATEVERPLARRRRGKVERLPIERGITIHPSSRMRRYMT
jgi:hypothetical protein